MEAGGGETHIGVPSFTCSTKASLACKLHFTNRALKFSRRPNGDLREEYARVVMYPLTANATNASLSRDLFCFVVGRWRWGAGVGGGGGGGGGGRCRPM